MKFSPVDAKDKGAYSNFVAANGGSFLQSWEWGEWQVVLGRGMFRFWIMDDTGKQVGAIQMIRMALPLRRYYLYAPYGPVCLQNIQYPTSTIKTLLHQRFPDAVFVRIEPRDTSFFKDLSVAAVKTTSVQPAVTMLVDLHRPETEILASIHPKLRYNIRLAQKHGVDVQSELVVTPGHGLYAKEAVDLIVQTQLRQGYRGHSENYYRKFVDFFAVRNANGDVTLTIYKALYQRKALASAIMVDFGSIRTYVFGGSAEVHREVMASYLLQWQALNDAREKGLAYYDLGGMEVSGGGERGFTQFKRRFNGQVVQYAGAHDVIFQPAAYALYKHVRKLNLIFRRYWK